MAIDVHSPFRLDGKVAIVTGASSGLGDRFARVLHAAGAPVVVAARRRERLDALVASLGDGAVAVTCDVASDDDCARLVETTLAEHGQIDVLVNNAGLGSPIAAEDEPTSDFRRVLDVNVSGLFALSQLVGRHMMSRRSGSIVNIASMLGMVASAPVKQASYCASKGAVVNLTRELAAQWARKGIRVNAIAPGWFPSELTTVMFEGELAEASQAWVRSECPMARTGEPHELDGILLFLAGDASSYCTGQTIAVDGGWTAR